MRYYVLPRPLLGSPFGSPDGVGEGLTGVEVAGAGVTVGDGVGEGPTGVEVVGAGVTVGDGVGEGLTGVEVAGTGVTVGDGVAGSSRPVGVSTCSGLTPCITGVEIGRGGSSPSPRSLMTIAARGTTTAAKTLNIPMPASPVRTGLSCPMRILRLFWKGPEKTIVRPRQSQLAFSPRNCLSLLYQAPYIRYHLIRV